MVRVNFDITDGGASWMSEFKPPQRSRNGRLEWKSHSGRTGESDFKLSQTYQRNEGQRMVATLLGLLISFGSRVWRRKDENDG